MKAQRPPHDGHALATTVVALSVLAPALNAFITSTVFPSAVADIGGLSIYAWGSTAYAVLLLQTIHDVPPAVAGYLQASQSFSWTMATLVGARLDADRVRAAIVLGPCLVTAGFVGLFATIGSGPLALIAVCIVLVGVGIGTCWAHVSRIILVSGRPDEAALTASVVPTGQQLAIAFGAAVSGIVVNATGLSTDPSPPVAALTGAALYGGFALAPLAPAAIALRLRSAVDAPPAPAIARR